MRAAVAQHLGTDHTELMLSAADAQAIIPQLPAIYDEPFADCSQLPTYLVSRLARGQVDGRAVRRRRRRGVRRLCALSGRRRGLWNAVRRGAARRAPACGVGPSSMLSPDAWDALARAACRAVCKPSHFGDKVHKGAGLLAADGPLEMYRRLISQWPDPERLLPRIAEPPGWVDRIARDADRLDTVGKLRLLDMMSYLPDDILTKVDRASMAVSLEARVPLLDHRVVEFAWRLPSDRLIANGEGKRPLRAVLSAMCRWTLVDRPKMGFGVPIGEWLRGPLRDWAEDLLSPARSRRTGCSTRRCCAGACDEHLSGRRNWQYALWTVLQFQAWRRANG